jgi:hypothetical protein
MDGRSRSSPGAARVDSDEADQLCHLGNGTEPAAASLDRKHARIRARPAGWAKASTDRVEPVTIRQRPHSTEKKKFEACSQGKKAND